MKKQEMKKEGAKRMVDWNGDGRKNNMDQYDMIQDTSNKKGNYGGYHSGGAGSAILKYLLVPAIALFISLFNEHLGFGILLIWGAIKIGFPK